MVNKSAVIPLEVTEFSPGGHGQGIWQAEGRPPRWVEVPFAVPGDQVTVHPRKVKRDIYRGHPVEWLKPSPQRIEPRCRHFGQCGGCQWQHTAYAEQLKQKESRVRRYLAPFLSSETLVYPIVPCLPPWHYRNKMELTFSSDNQGKRYLGLIMYGTRGHVFQMQECHLAPPWMAEAVHTVSAWWADSGWSAYQAKRDQGALRTLTLREGASTGDRLVMLTVSGNPAYALPRSAMQAFVSALRHAIEPAQPEQKLALFLRIQQISKGVPTQFYEMLLHGPDHLREVLHIRSATGSLRPLHVHISPSAFFQPNTRQAEELYSRALQLAALESGEVVYDLYCGTGTLGMCLAHQAKEVVGIELSPEAALDARENARRNGFSNVTIRTGDVGDWLPTLSKEGVAPPDVALVDPPRSGLAPQALHHLLTLNAPRIVYVSCNPLTQAANIQTLVAGGYQVQAVQPIDQFPQTVHVENIVLLTRPR